MCHLGELAYISVQNLVAEEIFLMVWFISLGMDYHCRDLNLYLKQMLDNKYTLSQENGMSVSAPVCTCFSSVIL